MFLPAENLTMSWELTLTLDCKDIFMVICFHFVDRVLKGEISLGVL